MTTQEQTAPRRRGVGVTLALGAATVLLGATAVVAHQRADAINSDPSASNKALTSNAGTSQVKGEVSQAVNTLFSYDYADAAKTDKAAHNLLVGKAVGQYNSLLSAVHQQAPTQKLVLTTAVTDSAVKILQGDRARVLVFADQRSVRTTDGTSSYAAAMLAVDAVRQHGHWRISNIDTFT